MFEITFNNINSTELSSCFELQKRDRSSLQTGPLIALLKYNNCFACSVPLAFYRFNHFPMGEIGLFNLDQLSDFELEMNLVMFNKSMKKLSTKFLSIVFSNFIRAGYCVSICLCRKIKINIKSDEKTKFKIEK